MKRIGFIGIGNMGEALYSGFVAAGKLTPELAYAYTPNKEELEAKVAKLGLNGCDTLEEMLEHAEMILIACKPAQVLENARVILEKAPKTDWEISRYSASCRIHRRGFRTALPSSNRRTI